MNKYVPQLRFKKKNGEEYPEWLQDTVGESFDFFSTNSFSRNMLTDSEGEIKNIHYGDIHTKFPMILNNLISDLPFIKESAEKKMKSYEYCRDGDVLIADASEDYADIGKATEIINVGADKIVGGLHVLHLRDNKNKFSNKFKGYLFASDQVKEQIKTFAVGSKVLGISKPMLSKVNLAIPHKEEQEKISSFLSILDSRIACQFEKVTSLKELKKGYMQKIFSQRIRFKMENGEDYPDWEYRRLGDFSSRVIRKNKNKVCNRALTISSIDGLVEQESYFTRRVASANIEGYYLLIKGEFAYNKSYSNGYPWGSVKMLKKYDSGVLSTLYICFAIDESMDGEFVEQYFASTNWHNEISMIAVEGARNHGLLNVGVNDFFDTIHELPCKEEQQKIATFLTTLDAKIDIENQILSTLQTLKKGLLQQMFV